MSKKAITESIQEFLARGGKITVLPPATKEQETAPTINPVGGGPAVIMTYGEAALFYGEIKPRKARKKKPEPKIDLDSLPEALRNKYFKDLL